MELELFSASPQAAQMARARLRLALGAFGRSYSSLLATVHLSLSLLLSSERRISAGSETLPHIFTLHKVFSFDTVTSHICLYIQMYSAVRCVEYSAFCCYANLPLYS